MGTKLAVLLSGGGTTFENLIERIEAGTLDATVACVIGSRADAYGLERARNHNVPARTIVRKEYPDAASFNEALWETVRSYQVDLVVLAGFMSMIEVPDDFVNRIMNVHPALLPAFGGKGMYGHHVHEAVLAYGAKVSGATVHFVDAQYDHGPVILQGAVSVLDDDTPDSLAARVQVKERELYPQAVQLFAENRLRVEDRRVRIG